MNKYVLATEIVNILELSNFEWKEFCSLVTLKYPKVKTAELSFCFSLNLVAETLQHN